MIEGLRITLLDSTNLPAVHHGYPMNLFRPNSDYEACAHWQGGFMQGRQVCFPFAKDNYVLVIPSGYDTSKIKVLVQDPMAEEPHRCSPQALAEALRTAGNAAHRIRSLFAMRRV